MKEYTVSQDERISQATVIVGPVFSQIWLNTQGIIQLDESVKQLIGWPNVLWISGKSRIKRTYVPRFIITKYGIGIAFIKFCIAGKK